MHVLLTTQWAFGRHLRLSAPGLPARRRFINIQRAVMGTPSGGVETPSMDELKNEIALVPLGFVNPAPSP